MAVSNGRSRPILLVGMMGSGKSTVGPVLAGLLRREFVDLDRRIEAESGRSISELFETQGESAFRALERTSLEAAALGDAVVALGGGAIAQPGAPERLARLGTLVYLRASPDALMLRLGQAVARPLLAGLDRWERRERLVSMLQERESAYLTAEIVVDTDGQEARAVALQIARELGLDREKGG